MLKRGTNLNSAIENAVEFAMCNLYTFMLSTEMLWKIYESYVN